MPNRRRSFHRSRWVLAAAAVSVAGLVLTWRMVPASANQEGVPPTQASAGAVALAAAASPAASRAPAVARATATAASGVEPPGGLTADQWQTLQQRVEPGPLHDREVARIVDYLEFQRRVVRLRELRGDPGAAGERRSLALQVDAGIATHLALHEISASEAMLLETAVLAETEPDPTQRVQRLEAWRRAWAAEHPPENDPRIAEYRRREAAVVAAWQSGPPSQRDPARLARQLQQVQAAVFDPQP
jgi:hypothetical protein